MDVIKNEFYTLLKILKKWEIAFFFHYFLW